MLSCFDRVVLGARRRRGLDGLWSHSSGYGMRSLESRTSSRHHITTSPARPRLDLPASPHRISTYFTPHPILCFCRLSPAYIVSRASLSLPLVLSLSSFSLSSTLVAVFRLCAIAKCVLVLFQRGFLRMHAPNYVVSLEYWNGFLNIHNIPLILVSFQNHHDPIT